MPRVVQVVATANFAGVERYVSEVSVELAQRGWEVAVVGGDPVRMARELDGVVEWRPGSDLIRAAVSLARLGHADICHAHMTAAETAAVATGPRHGAPVVATRHFARHRGSSLVGGFLAPRISSRLARELAVSDYVADRLESPPDAVLLSGVRSQPMRWDVRSRNVLVLQRLEAEKDTWTALRAWRESALADSGWTLRIVGDGRERPALEEWVVSQGVGGVEFAGRQDDIAAEFSRAGIVLAPSSIEGFGFAVVEAMAAGIPVVASAAGGHLETIGRVEGTHLFKPGSVQDAAAALSRLASDQARHRASSLGRKVAQRDLTLSAHVDALLTQYESVRSNGDRKRRPVNRSELADIVVCSLERWDEVWRRNQFLVDQLLRGNSRLRVLFVEPPADVLFDLGSGRRPAVPQLRGAGYNGRLRTFRPLKLLPRRVTGFSDKTLIAQVRAAARFVGFEQPLLWINDVTYAPLIERTGWSSVYDVTDDWLLAPVSENERARLRRFDALAVERASEIVVCSDTLAASRGATRPVTLIPNAVDIEHFTRPRRRPNDLPQSPVAVYIGTLHDARLDIELIVEVARALPDLTLVFVGPDALTPTARAVLGRLSNLVLLGQRSYEDVPAYLQHADAIFVPHRVSAFTQSLDPIKAYECLAVATPTVATRIAGFRDDGNCRVVDREAFIESLAAAIDGLGLAQPPRPVPTWNDRAAAFEDVLRRIQRLSN